MKKLNVLKNLAYMVAAFSLTVFIACEGPAGAPGQNGANGADGKDGKDANETCKKCHNTSSSLSTKSFQLAHSVHQTGTAWAEGTRNSCAPCHSEQGFLDVIKNNPRKQAYVATAAALTDPTPLGCRGCHKIHTVYDSTDFNFTTTAAIDMLTDTTKAVTLDLGSPSNLCVKCHQPRIVKQMDFAGAPTGTYTGMTSYRWGTHYGTQGAIFGGKGYQIAGTETYANDKHTSQTDCATCHMAAVSGSAGGHTFNVFNEEGNALNTNGCVACHTSTSTLNTKVSTLKTEIDGLLKQLGNKLALYLEPTPASDTDPYHVSIGFTGYLDYYDASGNPDGRYKNPNSGNVAFPAVNNLTAAAITNFMLVFRDRSHGVHNPAYTRALLKNSIAALP